MKAVRYYGKEDVRVERVPAPTILNPRDAVVKVRTTANGGSDLHIYGGYIPTMQRGGILGHEFMGEMVAVPAGITHPVALDDAPRMMKPALEAAPPSLH